MEIGVPAILLIIILGVAFGETKLGQKFSSKFLDKFFDIDINDYEEN